MPPKEHKDPVPPEVAEFCRVVARILRRADAKATVEAADEAVPDGNDSEVKESHDSNE